MNVDERKYIRHPVEIPIKISTSDCIDACTLKNISQGGLCVFNKQPFEKGEKVDITISVCEPEFNAKAIVRWCDESERNYFIGIAFLNEQDAFTARMVEQICHIEEYRQQAERQTGQVMSSEQAAREWIEKHAGSFPNF